ESLAIALGRGQSAMGIEGNQWYRPVLYLRWEDNEGGQLFKASSVEADALIKNNLQLQKLPSPDKRKVTKKLSRVTQLKIAGFKQDLEELEKDYTNVAETKRFTSNPQESNNLELQLEKIAKDMDKIEQQLHELEYGDE
ncbi:hypothetical protein, partial [Moorena sp. SIO3I6]|uniref:hypothetical protein n=1 Tax=Moorena sp. SIO3I6 TaxID=2607831 RepID=UPI0013FAED88|nr:hypothetical protein [Moorena sp. SIO3I6]